MRLLDLRMVSKRGRSRYRCYNVVRRMFAYDDFLPVPCSVGREPQSRAQTYEQRQPVSTPRTHATTNAARVNLPSPIYRGPSSFALRALRRSRKPHISRADQVCPVERPERCSTSHCRRQRGTSARHVSSRAQLAAQPHLPANINDVRPALCTLKHGFAMCAFRSTLRS